MLNKAVKKTDRKSRESAQTVAVHSIETMGLVDGPGIRTVFFLQGCPLRCAYCHNPDTQPFEGGERMTADDILKTALRYKSYYGDEGGVTFSGGEPLAQAKFLAEVMPLLKSHGINIALDTSGYGQQKYYEHVLPYVDVMLLDIKAFNYFVFEQLVGAEISIFLNFLNSLEQYGFKGKIWLRHVMIPGLTNDDESMQKLVELALPIAHLVDRIEILPYHTMGAEKYRELKKRYRLQEFQEMDGAEAKLYEIYANKHFAAIYRKYRNENNKDNLAFQRVLEKNNNFLLATTLLNLIKAHAEIIENKYKLEFSKSYREILDSKTGINKSQLIRKIGEFKDLGYITTPDSHTIILEDLTTLENYRI